MQSIATIYVMSVACYQDKHQLNSKLADQVVHNSLGKECPAIFWHHLLGLTIPSDRILYKTVGIFMHSPTVVAESCRIVVTGCCR